MDNNNWISEQERAASIFDQEKGNFRLVFPDLPESTVIYFAKEAAKNTAGECMLRRFEIFKFGDLETTEGYWQRVIKCIDEIPSQLTENHPQNTNP